MVEQLPRVELRHGDGRRLLVYGEFAGGTLPLEGAAGEWPALHLRRNPLTRALVAVSPARNTRPQTAGAGGQPTAACPLCVGGPEVPFPYEAAVFDNRFPTLLPDPPEPPERLAGETAPALGACEVVLYTPTHTGSLATLSARELARVIAIWTDRSEELCSDPRFPYVLVFENRGEDVGATLSHPHGQIYALGHLPPFVLPRVAALDDHRLLIDTCLTCEVVASDLAAADRQVVANDSFTVAVPFAPDWPLEIHVRAKRHGARRLPDLTAPERRDLATALRAVVHRYDALYEVPLAYLMVCQQAPDRPLDGRPVDDWHLSFEFLPPNRSPHKLKVRASVETAAGLFINDTLPEATAGLLAAAVDDDRLPDDATFPDVEVVAVPTGVPAANVADPRLH
jgi:UDPglucose--hexose-1-phosphate uridylyltransferase